MEAETPRVGQRRPGGRSARVRAAVLAAAADALAENGYNSFTIEDVAERAGVHKTTVYRRWPTKAELIADTTRERSQQLVPMPDTGTLADDLRALARAVVKNIGSETGGRMTRTLVAAATTSPENAAQSAAFWAERLSLTNTIFDRAVERGEIPPGTDGALIIQTLIGPLYVRLLLTQEPIDAAFADRVAAFVCAAVGGSLRTNSAGTRSAIPRTDRRPAMPSKSAHVKNEKQYEALKDKGKKS